MKALLACCGLLLLQPTFLRGEPPAVSEADTLTPKDLGIHKYVFKATPGDKQVVTVREERFLNGKLAETKESISYPLRNEAVQEEVLFINQSFLNDDDRGTKRGKNYRIAGLFEERIKDARLRHLGNGEHNSVEMEFDAPEGSVKYVISVFVEDYETAKKRNSSLPEMSPTLGWSYMDDEEADDDKP